RTETKKPVGRPRALRRAQHTAGPAIMSIAAQRLGLAAIRQSPYSLPLERVREAGQRARAEAAPHARIVTGGEESCPCCAHSLSADSFCPRRGPTSHSHSFPTTL